MPGEVDEPTTRLVEVLHLLDQTAEANIRRSEQIRARIDHVVGRLEAGEDLPEIVETEPAPRIPLLVTENIEALQDAGSKLRKTQAAALRAEGYTMESIAELFGVTRQRISALLNSDS